MKQLKVKLYKLFVDDLYNNQTFKDRTNYLSEQKVKYYMFQLLKAIEHMHKNGIFHRDIKPYSIKQEFSFFK